MASGTIKAVVPKSDIVDNLTTNDSTKVLSAAQGYALNSNIGALTGYVTVDATTSQNANVDLTNILSKSYIPIMFKGTIYGEGHPVYAAFGEWDTSENNGMKIFDYMKANEQLSNTRVVGKLYYIKL